ncbi:MAG: type II toxin-antitoxin system RelE/ParE family toxin [Anaerolineales bacterium]|nr:type II toxin-antitoxin system RelE/ParE family toxin [Anaerolineales bacterium]
MLEGHTAQDGRAFPLQLEAALALALVVGLFLGGWLLLASRRRSMERLHPSALAAVEDGLSELDLGAPAAEFEPECAYDYLRRVLDPTYLPPPPTVFFSRRSMSQTLGDTWTFGSTSAFEKSVRKIDKPMRAEVLRAILDLAQAPTTPRGDTIKPLERDLKGLWRYRIGDFRLIYRPEHQAKRVDLLLVCPRGSAYG